MGMKKMKNIPFRLNILYVKTRFKNKILEHKLVLGISIFIIAIVSQMLPK